MNNTIVDFYSKLINIIWKNLDNKTRLSKYKNENNVIAGQCYVVTEALYHLGFKELGFQPMVTKFLKENHWYLKHPNGEVIDGTKEQYTRIQQINLNEAYDLGKFQFFLTPKPCKRTQILLNRISAEIQSQRKILNTINKKLTNII